MKGAPDLSKLENFVNSKIPDNVNFKIPHTISDQELSYISTLDPLKATGLDELGPKIIKSAACILSPIIAAHINKVKNREHFLASSNVHNM